jgi:hypothetical protein
MCSRALTHQYVLIDDEVLHLTLAYKQGKRVRVRVCVYAQESSSLEYEPLERIASK